MKTSFVVLAGLFVVSANVLAQQDSVFTAKPILLCYVSTEPGSTTVESVGSSTARRTMSLAKNGDFSKGASAVQTSRENDKGTDHASIAIVADGLSYSTKTLISRIELPEREKFCLGNLLEGTVYDFKKRNRLRVDTGLPIRGLDDRTLDWRYEEPFCVAFFLRFKL